MRTSPVQDMELSHLMAPASLREIIMRNNYNVAALLTISARTLSVISRALSM